MSIILSTLFSLLSNVPGMMGDYFKKKQELESKKLDVQLALEEERLRFAAETAKSDSARAQASLAATGSYFKYCVFWLISSPFIACLIGQDWYATMVFNNLKALPDWYMILYSAIVGVIWGIPVPGSVMGNIWSGIQQASANRRELKLAKFNDKKYFDIIKQLFPKGMNQNQVDIFTKAKEEAQQ